LSPGLLIVLVYAVLVTGVFSLYDSGLLYLIIRMMGRDPRIVEVFDSEADGMPEFKLPTMTVLLPLYKERRTLARLVKSVLGSDYPREKLDVRFLVEHDDALTLGSILELPDKAGQAGGVEYDAYGIPKSVKVWNGVRASIDVVYEGIRTKPNALNVGLKNARGSIITIYDAEDRPDLKQLRKVAVYMTKHPGVACVQARLSYYNPDQSVLTKLFAVEYIQHFLVYLPELYMMKNVIPLGGTSNFFRVEVLRGLEGWDPKNVTEDADLGIRLSRLGYSVVPINTVTWEEAPPKLYFWIRQRVRWNKGFLYTLAVHYRNPRKLVRDVGLKQAAFLFLLLVYPIISMIAIFGWAFFLVYWINWFGLPLQPLAGWVLTAYNYSPLVFYTSMLTFAFGILYGVLTTMDGLFRQGDEYALRKVKYTLISPLYLLLHAVASLIAVVELLLRPQVWHKTPHGFSIEEEADDE
jgi:cellulose synthase/poly-beta-1,6-N-acetylglucosamine synthase-like glycosyltransferase